jgi:hypothetical protein
MKTNNPYILIVSAEIKDLDAETNANRHEKAKRTLDNAGVSFKEGSGQYYGVIEKCFVLAVPFLLLERVESIVQNIAQECEQECYLISDNERQTSLRRPDGSRLAKLGTLAVAPEAKDNFVELDGVRFQASNSGA